MHGDFSIEKVEAINMQISLLALQSLIALYIMQIPRLKNLMRASKAFTVLKMQADCWKVCQFFESAGSHIVDVITGCVVCLHNRGSSPTANTAFLNCTFCRACEKQLEQQLLPSFYMPSSQEMELEGTSGEHLVYHFPKAGLASSELFQTVTDFWAWDKKSRSSYVVFDIWNYFFFYCLKYKTEV